MRPDGLKKIYYSIREVSETTGVEPHVLRFWEKEFPMLRPRRSRSGNRTYRQKDIDLVHDIRRLLWDEKYTIQGACEQLKRDQRSDEAEAEQGALAFPDTRDEVLGALREELLELKKLITGSGRSE